nr:MAG TPA: PROTEIN/DNA Complex catalytic motif, Helix-turn-helix DNA [Caudoviricetes sp.]
MIDKYRRKIYLIWYNMLRRCENPNYKSYQKYGANGVKVCEEWHNFECFLSDMPKIRGFNKEQLLNGELSFDKDIYGDSKEYCLEKCCFVSKEENNKHKPNQQKHIIGISPNNELFEFFNQSEFAKKHGLRQTSIADCLSGKCKTHRKWRFYFKSQQVISSPTTIERVSDM